MQQRNNGCGPGTQAACASCKHQRKRCDEKCVLSPYFPADRAVEFQAVHRVFGVSNVSKMVQGVAEEHRRKVADSLIWEATWRQRDPVHGAYAEYKRVQDELNYYKGLLKHQLQGSTLVNKLGPSGRTLLGWNYGSSNGGMCPNNGSSNSKSGGFDAVAATATATAATTVTATNYIKDSGSSVIDSGPYSCAMHNNVQGSDIVNQEREPPSAHAIPLQPHQYWVNGFNHQQQYYLSGT